MKYAQQIQQYQLNHEADSKTENATEHPLIQNWNEEPKDDHPRDPLAGAQLKDIDPKFEETQETPIENETFSELAEKMIQEKEQQKATPKKQRGRPVGSKNKAKKPTKKPVVTPVAKEQPKSRRTRTPHISETKLTVGMSQELFDDIEKAATHNFRTLANEVCWVLTQYYNGKL